MLDFLFCIAKPCRIGKPEHGFIVNETLFDIVPCGTRHMADDRPLFTKQDVKQRRFAGVGFADDGGCHTFAQQSAMLIGVNELLDFTL